MLCKSKVCHYPPDVMLGWSPIYVKFQNLFLHINSLSYNPLSRTYLNLKVTTKQISFSEHYLIKSAWWKMVGTWKLCTQTSIQWASKNPTSCLLWCLHVHIVLHHRVSLNSRFFKKIVSNIHEHNSLSFNVEYVLLMIFLWHSIQF